MKANSRKIFIVSILILSLSILHGITHKPLIEEAETKTEYSYRIINKYPHDPEAFTQGLVFDNGTLYEGTGLNGKSSVRVVDLKTGNVSKIKLLPQKYFGEGITVIDDRLIQITWRSREAFVYDKISLKRVDFFQISTEGWGLTHNGSHLIISDGTSTLYYLNSTTYNTVKKVTVTDNGKNITKINELEFINGKIYANIWQTDLIVIIDPEQGNVTGWINLEGIQEYLDHTDSIDVLNGIAYDKENDKIYVTGKLWPNLFEIRLIGFQ